MVAGRLGEEQTVVRVRARVVTVRVSVSEVRISLNIIYLSQVTRMPTLP